MAISYLCSMADRISDIAHLRVAELGSKSMAKKAIKRGELYINERVAYSGDYVSAEDVLAYRPMVAPHPPLELDIAVVYEDEYIAVVNKPAGLSVSGNQHRQLDRALPYNLRTSVIADRLPQPMPVHRLDKATCGLVLCAKTATAQRLLGERLAQGRITKGYQAILLGALVGSGSLINPIEGKSAMTEYMSLATYPSVRYGHLTHIALVPISGRTHQLRIHCSSLGFPIMGDRIYCPPALLRSRGLRLMATSLSLDHPISGESLTITLPFKWQL